MGNQCYSKVNFTREVRVLVPGRGYPQAETNAEALWQPNFTELGAPNREIISNTEGPLLRVQNSHFGGFSAVLG